MAAPPQALSVTATRRANLYLALAVVALGAIAGYTLLRPAERPAALVEVYPRTVSEIRIEHAELAPIRLRRDPDWRMLSPLPLPADEVRIDALLEELRQCNPEPIEPAGAELQRYALDTPETVLHVDEHTIAFGSYTPLDLRRYVLYMGHVYLIEDRVSALLQAQELFFARHDLLPADFRLAAVVYFGTRYRLQGGGAGIGLPPDRAKRLAKAWRYARATLVSRLQERSGSEELVLENPNGEELRFLVFATDASFVLARADLGVRYHLDALLQEELFPESLWGERHGRS